MPFVEEPAAGNAVGHFWSPSSINGKTSTRTSSLYAYYDQVSNRKNLRLLAKHQVTEVTFDENLAATGVKALNRDDEQYVTFGAKREVVLAAGAGEPATGSLRLPTAHAADDVPLLRPVPTCRRR